MSKLAKVVFSPSSLSLILVNLTPLFGVMFWSWDAFSVIILYWLETIIVGFFNFLKMREINKKNSPYPIFFIAQYIIFLLAYLFLILNIFEVKLGSSTDYIEALKIVFAYLYTLLISSLFIFISHGLSFQYNFINKKEFLHASVHNQFLAPYKRLLIMHIVIILAAKGITYYNYSETLSAIVFLLILKIIFDLIAHVFEHRKSIGA